MSISTIVLPSDVTGTTTTANSGVFGTGTSAALFTLLLLVIIILGCGGRIFGGYSNYPGYGGFSEFGYTVPRWRRPYRYNPYDIYDD